MKILNNNYNVFIDPKEGKITCIDAGSVVAKTFFTIKEFKDFIMVLPPKKINIYYVGQRIDVVRKEKIITSGIINRIKKLNFEKARAKESVTSSNVHILNNFGVEDIVVFESTVSTSSLPKNLKDLFDTIINSQHVIHRFLDVGYFLYKASLRNVKTDSYHNSLCIADLSFLDDIYVIEFIGGIPDFIKKLPKDNLVESLKKIKSYCQEKEIVNDDNIIITDDKAKIIDDIESVFDKDLEKIEIKELSNFNDQALPLSVFENIYYNKDISNFLHHSRVITNIKRIGGSAIALMLFSVGYNFYTLKDVKQQRLTYNIKSEKLSKDIRKLESINIDEFYVKNLDSLRCIECEGRDKLNINNLVARLDDKIEDEKVNKISFAKNSFAIELESEKDIAKKFADNDFDVFVEKTESGYKKLSQIEGIGESGINYKIKGRVIR